MASGRSAVAQTAAPGEKDVPTRSTTGKSDQQDQYCRLIIPENALE
jgi:hypothetical protein